MELVSLIIFGVLFYIFYTRFWKKDRLKFAKKQRWQSGNSVARLYSASHVNAIVDRFQSLDDVSDAVKRAGLEECSLIFGIDYTVSNMHQGELSFYGKNLHTVEPNLHNPYQQVICCLGETLEPLDSDGMIPAFGFGDATTKDFSVFPFKNEGFCHGFQEVLHIYNYVAQRVRMSGPTNFAPLINRAIEIVKMTKSYHILVIVADGQVTRERDTQTAIVEASKWPLSIIVIGVGDGPWDTMAEFDDGLPERKFDNFQFVDFNKVTRNARNPEASFALHALMEIPDQYKQIHKLGLLSF
ncbi:copine family protein 1-like isoform X2 [Liolophura sinensis]|uniref:copine family protein 1-like isoform X2 n=1 Tax=Liolophura sinensis TaxID=3198878 RepID=UPI00315943B6